MNKIKDYYNDQGYFLVKGLLANEDFAEIETRARNSISINSKLSGNV